MAFIAHEAQAPAQAQAQAAAPSEALRPTRSVSQEDEFQQMQHRSQQLLNEQQMEEDMKLAQQLDAENGGNGRPRSSRAAAANTIKAMAKTEPGMRELCPDTWYSEATANSGPGMTARPNLEVRKSDIAQVDMQGLFTTQPIPRGGWIGFYTGNWYTMDEFNQFKDQEARNRYAVTVLDARPIYNSLDNPQKLEYAMVISPEPVETNVETRISSGDASPNLSKDMMAAINEPPLVNKFGRNGQANVYARQYAYPTEAHPPGCPDSLKSAHAYLAFSFFACRDIAAGEELYWHYGPKYPREGKYKPGRRCEQGKTARGVAHREAGIKYDGEVHDINHVQRVVQIIQSGYGWKAALYPIDLQEDFSEPTAKDKTYTGRG